MIHLKVKQIRYKYRYGCNMKKPKNKKQKPNLGVWGTMHVNTVPTKLSWWLIDPGSTNSCALQPTLATNQLRC